MRKLKERNGEAVWRPEWDVGGQRFSGLNYAALKYHQPGYMRSAFHDDAASHANIIYVKEFRQSYRAHSRRSRTKPDRKRFAVGVQSFTDVQKLFKDIFKFNFVFFYQIKMLFASRTHVLYVKTDLNFQCCASCATLYIKLILHCYSDGSGYFHAWRHCKWISKNSHEICEECNNSKTQSIIKQQFILYRMFQTLFPLNF